MLGDIPNVNIKPLVIFGAGASYDLIDDSEDPSFLKSSLRPPLSNNLFDSRPAFKSLLVTQPRLQGLVGVVRKWQGNGLGLEESLDKVRNDPNDGGKFATEIVALTNYLGSLFKVVSWENREISGNNYHTFFRALKCISKEFCIVNFNYDYLAQKALSESLGIEFSQSSSFIDGPIKFIYPHGSIMWGRYASNQIKINSSYQYSGDGSTLVVPTITGKSFSCPIEHIHALQQFVTNDANVIIIIGWKGKEDHFNDSVLKLIKNPPRRIIIVGGGDSATGKAVINNTGLNKFGGISRIYISGFSNLLKIYPDFNMESRSEHLF
ncbi:MAG: hypothetical protein WCX97_02060 [Candidatus Magasanikbacteria bacterium]